MEYTVRQADKYISDHRGKVDPTFRMAYHFMPPTGWMNDPNGLIYYGGRYHLFYQFYPYEAKNGPMHWGHFVSSDLVSYSDEHVALAPDAEWESGCFSGGAEVQDGELCLVYTRHYDGDEHNGRRETVCVAKSADGVEFVKHGPVFDNATLPDGVCRSEFRDPCPVKIGERYYVFLGGKLEKENRGIIVVLSGESLFELAYDFCIGPFDELGEMAECPSYCRVDGKDVIIASGVDMFDRAHDYKNKWSSYFIVGELDIANKRFNAESIQEIDRGDAFYAPQFVRNAPTPTIIGWLENWGKRYPTRELGHGWVGSFSVPRELRMSGGAVLQTPVSALNGYRTECDPAAVLPRGADIEAEFSGEFSLALRSADGSVTVGSDGRIYLDTRFSNNQNGKMRHTQRAYPSGRLRILFDVSGVELFVEGGAEAISSRMYLSGDVTIEATGGVSSLKVYKIGVTK